jgi:hypothetical protein
VSHAGGQAVTAGPGRHGARPRRKIVQLHLAVVGGYLLLSLVLWSAVWVSGHPTHTVTCLCGDPAEEIWWLKWLPWALAHGHNPFFTNALYAGRGGVNLLANASIEAPALLLSPITILFGPVAALNTGALLAPVLSAWCMFLLTRKVTRFVPGQFFAGALWGFSPYVIGNLTLEHLPHVFGFFAPLSALVVLDLLVEQKRPPWLDGLLLAGLVVLQFFTSTEVLAMTALFGLVASVITVIVAPNHLWKIRRRAFIGAGTGIATATLVLAYPTWFAIAGPRSITGSPWGPLLAVEGSAVSAIVSPGPVVHRTSFPLALYGYYGPVGPSEGYLGWALILFIALSAILWWRRRVAWYAVIVGALAWALSWGINFSSPWRPWRLFTNIPIVSSIQPERFTAIVAFCAALLLAISLDAWANRVRRRLTAKRLGGSEENRTGFDWSRVAPGVLVAAVGLGVLIPIASTYTVPFTEHVDQPSVWFSTVATRLPQGTRVLALPYGPVLSGTSMAYQAIDSLRFDLAGGYQIVPGLGRKSIIAEAPPVDVLLNSLSLAGLPGLPKPAANTHNISLVRSAVARWHIQLVAIVASSSDVPYAVSFMTTALRRPPIRVPGAWVWIMGCSASHRAGGLCHSTRSTSTERRRGPSRM